MASDPSADLLRSACVRALGGEPGDEETFRAAGGDSLLALRVVAELRDRHWYLPIEALLGDTRFGELAARMRSVPPTREVDPVPAPLQRPLAPLQAHFFDQTPLPQRWNISRLFALPSRCDMAALAKAVEVLIHHHEALGIRLERQGSGWVQVVGEASSTDPVLLIDLSALPEEVRKPALTAAADALQGSLHPERSPMIRLAHFLLGSDEAPRLLVIVHHLAIDRYSLDIVVQDLARIYEQIVAGEPWSLPASTTRFDDWVDHLYHYAASDRGEHFGRRWAALPWAEVRPLPLDLPGGANSRDSVEGLSAVLSPEATEALLEPAKRLGLGYEELFLGRLAHVIARWSSNPTVLVNVIHHGRRVMPGYEAMDLSRSVGCFAENMPVLLKVDPERDLESQLPELLLRESASVHHEAPFYLPRYLAPAEEVREQAAVHPIPDLALNYFGHFARIPEVGRLLREPAFEPVGTQVSAAAFRRFVFLVYVQIVDGGVRVLFQYSHNLHRRETVEALTLEMLGEAGSKAELHHS